MKIEVTDIDVELLSPAPLYSKDDPLAIAHLLGGANGVNIHEDLNDTEIDRRVKIAMRYWLSIKKQLTEEKLKQLEPLKEDTIIDDRGSGGR